MSLDVYLYGPSERVECDCPECGNGHWRDVRPCLFNATVTHNLGGMADEAGIYRACWRPGEVVDTEKSTRIQELEKAGQYTEAHNISKTLPTVLARDLIPHLQAGLALLRAEPDRFKALNPPNGWGTYEGFVRWVERYLAACAEHPDAEVEVSR